MRKKFFFLAALLTAMGMNLWALDPVSYLYPVYNTADDPSSGIKEWKTGSCTEYTVVENASSSSVTWIAGWYVVNGADVNLSKATCSGAVHLILVDGAKLTVGKYVKVNGGDNSIAIYGQDGQTGQLINNLNSECAGIGGGSGGSGSNITINGGTVTAKGGTNGAGIGGGWKAAGSNITINGGTVTATGGSSAAGIGGGENGNGSNIIINGGTVTATGGPNAAGIGGGYKGTGSIITINGGTVTATGSYSSAGIGGGVSAQGSNITINGGTVNATGGSSAAGIGGGENFDGSNIIINGGTVNATGGSNAAGIGGGYYGTGSNITINGDTVTATGGSSAAGIGGGENGNGSNIIINGGTVTTTGGYKGAGIGGGYKGTGSNITINGGTVTATSGYSSAAGIGKGTSCTTAASNIFVNPASTLKAGSTTPPTTEIAHATITTDIAVSLDGKRYVTVVTVVTPEPENVTFSETGTQADITAYKNKLVNATIARTFYKDGERNSICLPFALSTLKDTPLEGGTLEEFSSAEIVNKGKDNETLELTMTPATSIEAGKPYLITWTSGENIVSPVFNNVTITTDEASASEKKEGVQFCGTFVPKAVTEGDKGILFVGLEGALNWPNVGGNINGFRSYFTVDVDAQSPIRRGMNARIGGGKNTPTELDEAAVAAKVQKLIEAGKVVIISNGVRYDLNGNIVK